MTENDPQMLVASGRLAGRIALVAGGAGGCGRSIAAHFAAADAYVMVADIAESAAKAVADDLGPRVDYATLDVRRTSDWASAVDACKQRFGEAPDVMVNAAGVMTEGSAESVEEETMRFAYDVNVQGVVNGIQAVVPGMRRLGRGSIVIITSMGGPTFGVAHMTPYAASKAAATAVVQSAAGEFGHAGIRINAILPGQIDTPMSQGSDGSASHAFFERMPIPRIGHPRDIAQAALYLASDESSWITGTKFLIDGGMTAGPILG